MVCGMYVQACVLFQTTEVLNGSTDTKRTSKKVIPRALPNALNVKGRSLGYILFRRVLTKSVSKALCGTSPSSKNLGTIPHGDCR